MSVALEESLRAVQAEIESESGEGLFTTSSVIADRRISAECDDPSYFSDFFPFFGGPPPRPGRVSATADLQLSIRTCLHPELGWFRLTDLSETPIDAREFSFALEQGQIFDTLGGLGDEWTALFLPNESEPVFAFRGAECLFGLNTPWRKSINWFALWRLMRIRTDAIFFHASALGIGGKGTIFVGPKGAGKSTTSLALAARGHNLLSDEIAGYQPATGNLVPFRRPVGIKPGPRARAVAAGLDRESMERIDRDGFVRVDVDSLFPVEPARSYPLQRIVFLRGFRSRPEIARIDPGREEIVELQPLMSSFLNAAHSRRVFELVKLLSSTAVYRLHPGDPDETADYLQEVFANE